MWLKFEWAYYDVIVQHIIHYAMRTLQYYQIMSV